MKQVAGIWLPDYDIHFEAYLKRSPKIDGKGTYQLDKLKAALYHVRNFECAIDVGAHVGLWTRILSKHFNCVMAFEPVPQHIECFKRNLEDLLGTVERPGKVTLLPYALGSHQATVHLCINIENSGASYVEPMTTMQVAHEQHVVSFRDQYALDSFPYPQVDFIKIDVEGYELEVVKGAERTIKTHKPVIVVEQKNNAALKYGFRRTEAVSLLMKWGAQVMWEKAGDYCLVF